MHANQLAMSGIKLYAFVIWFIFNAFVAIVGCQNSNQANARRQIFPLRSYKDAQFTRFNVVEEAVTASWTFTANITGGCQPVNVTVILKWKGFPVINIRNAKREDNFVIDEKEQHRITLKSDSKLFTYNITNPFPGEWFALVFTDKIENRILPKGLLRECQAYFASQLTFEKSSQHNHLVYLSPSVPTPQLIRKQQLYKFYSSQQILSAKFYITKCSLSPKENDFECPITVFFRGLALPTRNRFDNSFDCKHLYNKRNGCQSDELNISRNAWNYLLIHNEFDASVEFELLLITADCLGSSSLVSNPVLRTATVAPSLTTTLFPYGSSMSPVSSPEITTMKIPSSTPQKSSLLNASKLVAPKGYYSSQSSQKPPKVCSQQINLMRYNYPGYFEFKYDTPDIWTRKNRTYTPFISIINSNPFELKPHLISFEVIPNVDTGGNLVIEAGISPSTETKYHNVSLTLCLNYNYYSLSFNDCLKLFSVNTTKFEIKSIVIPYPRAGIWYLTARTDCFFSGQEFVTDSSPVNCEQSTTSIVLDVKSSSCNEGRCGKYGDCYQKIESGFIFSTCVCKRELGWRGWFCEDGSEALRDDELLTNFMLLTISNLMFIPSVILAAYKRHYTEALVYFTTMVSSSLYHSCDSESMYSFCLFRINILQFGDFYSALLAFWVTLISLANMNDRLKSFFHIFGAILIGFIVQYDRTSMWAFVLPCGIGSTILFIAWVSHCVRRRACFPSGKHWFLSIVPGFSLAIGGLVLFAFFETKENYKLTHSIWHGVMALSLLLLIPSMRSEQVEDEEDFRGKVSMQNAKLAHVEWRPNTSFKFLQDDIDML